MCTQCSLDECHHRLLLRCSQELAEAFYLATLGGADVMGLGNKIGNFEVGKEFDALIVNPMVEGACALRAVTVPRIRLGGPPWADSGFDVYSVDTPSSLFEKFIFLGGAALRYTSA